MRPAVAGPVAALAVTLGLSAPPVPAQREDAVVVVEATRFPEPVHRLPASVTVLGAEEIAASAARTLPELLSQQVGIAMRDFFGNNAAVTGVDLRGFGVSGPQNTLLLLDGRRITDIDLTSVQWAAFPLSGIERIEILRGAGAVLYGDGATAGVINIVTRSPLKLGRALEAFGRAATFDTREGQLYASAARGNFGIDASVYGYASEGYRANNRNEQQNNTLNLRWGPGDALVDLRLGTDRQDLRLPGARRVQPSIGLDEYASDRRGAQTPLDFASRDGARAGLTLGHRLRAADLSLGIDWRQKDQRSYFDQGGFPVARADALHLRSLTPRARVPFTLAGMAHRLTLGADWNAWRYDSRRSDTPENSARPINRIRVAQDARALYLQDTVALSRASQVVAGWRSERVKFDATDSLDPAAPGFFFHTAAPAVRQSQRERAWELGLRHAISATWTAFVRTGRSFRFVNVDELYENDAFFNAEFQILRPQRARSREAGAEWRGAAAALRGTLFRNDVTDEIHLDPFTSGVGNTNLPPSRRQGVELEGRWEATRALRVQAAYAYTDARYREGVLAGSPFAIGTGIDVAGRTVPLVPRHKLNVSFSWELAAATRASGAVTAVSRQTMDNDEPNTLGARIPGYGVADLKIARHFGWGRLALAVNNVFDQRYYTYAVRSAFVVDRYSVYPLPGRTVGLTAEVRLD